APVMKPPRGVAPPGSPGGQGRDPTDGPSRSAVRPEAGGGLLPRGRPLTRIGRCAILARMSEALSLFAALLSALAAAVGAAVSVAQWRQTRVPGPGSPFGAVPGPATSRAPGPPADLAPPA